MQAKRDVKRRVLVVDGRKQLRGDLKAFLEESGGYEVIGEATALGEAIQITRNTSPEIVLVDIETTEGDWRRLLSDLHFILPSHALILAIHSDWEEYDAAARAAGAAATVTKRHLFETLLSALETAGNLGKVTGSNGDFNASLHERNARRSTTRSSKAAGVWWKPDTWGEWLMGAVSFGWVLVRAAPMDSSPSRSYWRHVEAGMAVFVSILLFGLLRGELDRAGDSSKWLIPIILLVLAGAQVRQLRRIHSARHAYEERSRKSR